VCACVCVCVCACVCVCVCVCVDGVDADVVCVCVAARAGDEYRMGRYIGWVRLVWQVYVMVHDTCWRHGGMM
jgi:hypothetical protein